MAADRRRLPGMIRKKCRCSCMIFFMWVYLILFVISSMIIFLSISQVRNVDDSLENINLPYRYYNRLSLSEQKHFGAFGWPEKQVRLPFDCSWLKHNSSFEFITSGWTKNIFKFKLRNESFAIKTVNADGEEMRRCTAEDIHHACYEQASSKLLKEFILLRELQHPNIVRVLGWCVSEEKVAMVLELCTPFDTMMLLRMSFLQRLKISADVSRLIYFLSSTPLGSIAVNDFRRQQFVLCGETLKLTDVDDVGIGEPACRHQQDCSAGWCTGGICKGHNDLQNVRLMFSQFFSLTFGFDTPKPLRLDLTNLMLGPKQWDSFLVLKLVERIVKFCRDNKGCN